MWHICSQTMKMSLTKILTQWRVIFNQPIDHLAKPILKNQHLMSLSMHRNGQREILRHPSGS